MKLFYRRRMKMAWYYFFHPWSHIKTTWRESKRMQIRRHA